MGSQTPNPSIEGTLSGLRPPSAPHVKRYSKQPNDRLLPQHGYDRFPKTQTLQSESATSCNGVKKTDYQRLKFD